MLKEFATRPKPVPARIVIEQRPDGMLQVTHNIASIPVLIGILSGVINTNAAQLVQRESLIIHPKIEPESSTEIPITDGDTAKP